VGAVVFLIAPDIGHSPVPKAVLHNQFRAFDIMQYVRCTVGVCDGYEALVLKSKKTPHGTRVVAKGGRAHQVNFTISFHEVLHEEVHVCGEIDSEYDFWTFYCQHLSPVQ
jgi:hypothetical protein